MASTTTAPIARPSRFVPPTPEPASTTPSSMGLLRLYRGNVLAAWPRDAYLDWSSERSMFGRPTLLISAAEAIRRVLIENVGNYQRTRPTIRIIGPLLGEGLFLAEGEAWRAQRRAVAPAFAPKAAGLFPAAAAAAFEHALPDLASRADAPVDLLGFFQTLALDVAGRAMFSTPMGPLGVEMRKLIVGYGERYGRPGLLDFFLPVWLPNPRDLGRLRFKRRWFALVDRLIATRAALPGAAGARDVFDLITTWRDPETGAAFPARSVRDQMATLLVAGHETTAVALFWAAYLLAEAPDWQRRVAEEAAPLDLSPAGAAAAIGRLVVARAVVEEALRLYPPAFVIVRQAKGPDRLGDVAVEAGAIVMIAPWVLHRHRRLWDDPGAFDPARFLPGAPTIDRFRYLPFGVGPRVCVGASLAIAEATVVVARLLQSFRIARADDRPVLPVAVVTTQPDRPAPFVLTPRR